MSDQPKGRETKNMDEDTDDELSSILNTPVLFEASEREKGQPPRPQTPLPYLSPENKPSPFPRPNSEPLMRDFRVNEPARKRRTLPKRHTRSYRRRADPFYNTHRMLRPVPVKSQGIQCYGCGSCTCVKYHMLKYASHWTMWTPPFESSLKTINPKTPPTVDTEPVAGTESDMIIDPVKAIVRATTAEMEVPPEEQQSSEDAVNELTEHIRNWLL